MYLDQENLFSDAQALTATAASTNVIDFGTEADPGAGEYVEVLVVANTQFDSAADGATLKIDIETALDGDEAFASAEILASSRVIPELELAPGEQVFKIRLPSSVAAYRYARLNYTVGTENFTAGTLTAGLIKDRTNYRTYPSGFSVS